jgi:hypothetical protein
MWWWERIPRSELGPSRYTISGVDQVFIPIPEHPRERLPEGRDVPERVTPTGQPSAPGPAPGPRGPGTLGEGRIPRGVLPAVGGLFGPVGRAVGTILDLFLGAQGERSGRLAGPEPRGARGVGGSYLDQIEDQPVDVRALTSRAAPEAVPVDNTSGAPPTPESEPEPPAPEFSPI